MTPTLQSLFVGLVIVILRYVFQALGVPVEDAFLTALAIAIVGWIMGTAAGKNTAQAIDDHKRARAARNQQ
jgi:hypothetical protein